MFDLTRKHDTSFCGLRLDFCEFGSETDQLKSDTIKKYVISDLSFVACKLLLVVIRVYY